MTLVLNNAESGSDGTTVTTANSGGTDANAFDNVVIGTNMTETFSNTHPAHGTLAFKTALTSTSTAITYLEWTSATFGALATEVYGAVYLCIVNGASGAPTSSIRFLRFFNGASAGYGVKIESGGTTMHISIMDGTGASVGTLGGTSAAGPAAGIVGRIEFHFLFNTGSGEVARAKLFTGDNLSVDETDAVLTATNIGAGFDGLRVGALTANFSSTSGAAFWVDSIALDTAATGFLGPGPYSAPSAGQIVYPDADIDAATWTTAPLWSKVDEVAAGGDVITATSS